jgi:hypothetical protein
MDPKRYPQLVQDILTGHAKTKPSYGDIEVQTIFDIINHRYQILHIGWHHKRWVHHCLMHLDVRNDKVWILHNTTEHELTDELIEAGVPKTDIVLGFCPEELRSYTEFAVK